MTNSWDTYYILFLSALLSLGIPASLFIISLLFFPNRKLRKSKSSSPQSNQKLNKTILGQRINVRFFLAVNAALVLITLAIELIPCSLTLQSQTGDGLVKGVISIVSIAGFAILGLLYSVRKGDMGWLSSYQSSHANHPKKKKNG